MRPAPPRLPIVRRPTARQALAAVLALTTLLLVHRVTSSASAATARLGSTATVWVATEALPVGTEVTSDAVAREDRPLGLIAGTPAGEPLGRIVRSDLLPGEVVVLERLGGDDVSGPAALVPMGHRGVAVPVGDAALPVAVGNRVDVVAAFDPGLAPPEPATVVVANARVVHVDDDRGSVTVAVPDDRVPAVAFALVTGIVTLALVP